MTTKAMHRRRDRRNPCLPKRYKYFQCEENGSKYIDRPQTECVSQMAPLYLKLYSATTLSLYREVHYVGHRMPFGTSPECSGLWQTYHNVSWKCNVYKNHNNYVMFLALMMRFMCVNFNVINIIVLSFHYNWFVIIKKTLG